MRDKLGTSYMSVSSGGSHKLIVNYSDTEDAGSEINFFFFVNFFLATHLPPSSSLSFQHLTADELLHWRLDRENKKTPH